MVQIPNAKNKKRSVNEKWGQESETHQKWHKVETHHLGLMDEICVRTRGKDGLKCPSVNTDQETDTYFGD